MKKDVLEALKARRSIRKYKPEQVSEELLNAVLEAGTYAPTAMGRQDPVMVVVQDPALRQKISEMNRKVAGSNSDPYYGAPTIILVLADGTHPNFIQDCSCVLANLMNAAYAAGLGSCWINRELEMFDSPEGKALLAEWGLPENFRGVGACALGYPDQELPEPKTRKDGYVIRK
ncbi:nitroreductase [Cuneatibacter sp. NSJ-177]|uniref:nitroreductase family protein n=1 Tax=Cuneatibacter sp. NSJ-177 TaxID=2931401 RepID=UPI001FD61C9B|nr:nitroreductase [Cuneatibacter sp. NSJ-177]MCJ7834059.1 nitroreductase [Cuneatibacter sp. NSJ-177]